MAKTKVVEVEKVVEVKDGWSVFGHIVATILACTAAVGIIVCVVDFISTVYETKARVSAISKSLEEDINRRCDIVTFNGGAYYYSCGSNLVQIPSSGTSKTTK
jgi:hypothetical protein